MLAASALTSCGAQGLSGRVSFTLHAPRAISAMNGFSLEQAPQPELDLQLAAIADGGVRVVRADAPWAVIEPRPPTKEGPGWRFARMDTWVIALATHDLTWEPIIDYSVWWAKNCPGLCAPSSAATYASFARAVAARYGPHGSFWREYRKLPYYPVRIFELWNEENVSATRVAPPEYAQLYAAARGSIRAVDPTASVIVGGLGVAGALDSPAQYVQRMFAADPSLRGNVDGFGLHPYGSDAVAVEQSVVQFRKALDKLGERSVPIDVTEFGWTTGDQAQETWRASMMLTLARNLSRSSCGIRLLAPYDWINLPGDSNGDFGLVEASALSASLRPAGAAWFDGLRLAASLPELLLCGG
jgi:Cellulase (glycosyl hydrolase family 5)